MHAGDGCPTPPSSSGWHLGGRRVQVGVLRAWRSCSTTSSRRHPDDLEGAGDDYIHPGVRMPARHTAHALPDKFELFAPGTSTSSAAAILHHGPAWGSLAPFLNKLFDAMLPEACRPRIRGWARLQQQGCRDFASMRQTGSADRRRQSELMHLLVRTFVCV